MAHQKINLPEKICIYCQKPMVWRKAWKHVWESVKYCSTACQRLANREARKTQPQDAPDAEPEAPKLLTQRFKRARRKLALPPRGQ